MNLYGLKKPFLVLAPMDDVTDTAFRQVVSKFSPPSLMFTEFVNVDGLQSAGRTKLIHKLRVASFEKPLIVQIWGKYPNNFYKTAKEIADGTFAAELGLEKDFNYAGVDLNMGCPQKNEVNAGTCSALINNRELAKEFIDATREGLRGKLPLSVKTRIGFNEVDMTWIEYLLNQKLNMLSVHGRTRKQMSKVPADWNYINQARILRDNISPNTLIIGNGDVSSYEQAMDNIQKYSLDGVMVGRGIFSDPYIFSPEKDWYQAPIQEKVGLYREHIRLFSEAFPKQQKPLKNLNKFCKTYINGFDGAKEIREKLMTAKDYSELHELLDSI